MIFKKKFILKNIKCKIGKKNLLIGSGTYANVYRTTKNYAVKSVKNEYEIDESFINEISILKYLNHPGIIKILWVNYKPIEFVSPVGIDNFYNIIIKHNPRLETRKHYFYCLFSALEYLHNNHCIHRDIKPHNIILLKDTKMYRPVLCDFGLSVSYFYPHKNSLNIVTEWWKAPEIYLKNKNYNQLIDIWALGKVLLESINGFLIKIENIDGIHNLIDVNGIIQEIEDNDEKQVISNCLTMVENRMTATQILNLKYFKDITYKNYRYTKNIKCVDLMIKDWETKNYKIKFKKNYKKVRFKYINYIIKKCVKLKHNSKVLYYTILLFDIYMTNKSYKKTFNYKLTINAIIYIAVAMRDKYCNEIRDLLVKNTYINDLQNKIYEMLYFFNYNLIFASSFDYLLHYLNEDKVPPEIDIYLQHLIMNSDNVEMFSPHDLAYICIKNMLY
jgi:serine/threonine protein kinase